MCGCSMVSGHRDEIENFAFDQGPESLPYYMCTTLLGVCQPHDLYDHGEL